MTDFNSPSRARPDGRPLFYDFNKGDKVPCQVCLKNGLTVTHSYGKAAMTDPVNPPPGCDVGGMYTVCTRHMPDNAVIYNHESGKCRNKDGTEEWTEDDY